VIIVKPDKHQTIFDNIKIIPNIELVVPDELADMISGPKKNNINSYLKGPKHNILIYREGGIGDLAASLFALTEYRKKYKNNMIVYSTNTKYFPILDIFDKTLITNKLHTIFPAPLLHNFSKLIDLTNKIENNNEKDIQTIIADELDVTITENTYYDLLKYNNLLNNRTINDNHIGFQLYSNVPLRNYNLDKFIQIINLLLRHRPNLKIFILDKPNNLPLINYIRAMTDFNPNIVYNINKNLHDMITLTSTLQLVIGPDSSFQHIAGVCDVPSIGLFGPFDYSKRISKYPKSIGVQASGFSCSPCCHHNPIKFCKLTHGEPACINSIEPEEIVNIILKHL